MGPARRGASADDGVALLAVQCCPCSGHYDKAAQTQTPRPQSARYPSLGTDTYEMAPKKWAGSYPPSTSSQPSVLPAVRLSLNEILVEDGEPHGSDVSHTDLLPRSALRSTVMMHTQGHTTHHSLTNRPAHAENAIKLGSNKGDSRLSRGLGERLALTHISHHTSTHIPTLTFKPPMVTVSLLTKPCMEPETYSIEKAELLAT